ncbi:MAG: META domain-containing protein [Bosea sp. (in: a-proteobacteria)]|uniref:META domain-containing protein n=1 Tax=Bosea sp. (in: a-proteobacteria) TaxID=1871050 RepID=UPI002732B708|nr:META domain-containing protein [Bosea sp. (in: a-proteobacteria)]MDP3257849.1 META domain-containing protein [Bosea sp. (in: a-proteobacteria)]MDP3320980.1 META domain-containing protein [Bosea sp. (in: a-proteobacteria)]
MIRRLGYAALLAAMAAPLLLPTDAQAQRRQQMPSREELGQQAPAVQQQQEKTFPLGASWSAVMLNGKPIADRRATLQVDANLRGTGFGGCNTFSASAYPLRQQGFAVGPLALTKRNCDKGQAEFERAYLTALRGTRNWDLVDGKLVLKGAAGELRFDRGF